MRRAFPYGLGDPDTANVTCPDALYVDNGGDCDDSDDSVGACASYRLFALVDDELFGIDTDTAAASVYASPDLLDAAQLTWDPDQGVFYTLDSGFDQPVLTAIDPCDGSTTPLGAIESSTLGTAYFCEGFDYDQENARLVASCSFDDAIANHDVYSESIVALDVATGAATLLASDPLTYLDYEFDHLVFVGGGELRALDGRGTVQSNRWFAVDGDTWALTFLRIYTPAGHIAWDWDNQQLYSIAWTNATTPFELVVQDVDNRAPLDNIGATGLTTNNDGMTFADFTCH